jgi:hypothetical protein
MKTYVKVALFVVSFIAIAIILAALYYYNLKQTDMSKAKPDFVLSSTLLVNAFENNETTASTKYINKIVQVTGIISSVENAANNSINITLQSGSDLSSVICTLPAFTDPEKIKKGEEITLRGECSGFLMDVLLNNCTIVKP